MKLYLTTQTVIETTITPPIFWRQGNEYRGLISEDDYREFIVVDKCVFFKITRPSINQTAIQDAFLEWEQISEETFMEKYHQVLESMSLTPKIQP